jgi:hypothetical protein
VRNARVRVIEKRTKGWYAYKPSTRTWVHTTTKALAWTKAGLALRVPGPLGKWTLPVAGLKKGTLLVRYSARDNVGNTSKPLVRSQQLTLP